MHTRLFDSLHRSFQKRFFFLLLHPDIFLNSYRISHTSNDVCVHIDLCRPVGVAAVAVAAHFSNWVFFSSSSDDCWPPVAFWPITPAYSRPSLRISRFLASRDPETCVKHGQIEICMKCVCAAATHNRRWLVLLSTVNATKCVCASQTRNSLLRAYTFAWIKTRGNVTTTRCKCCYFYTTRTNTLTLYIKCVKWAADASNNQFRTTWAQKSLKIVRSEKKNV